jgi:acyl-CoA dehydrogenase
VNRPLVRALGEHGLLEPVLPVGGKPSAAELCRIREALASESTEAETAFALQGLGGQPILASGRKEIVRRFVPAIVRGEAVAAFALTEPGAGSDVSSLALKAQQTRGGWRLSGVKKWISNAPEADVYTVFARTTEGTGIKGITAFVVPAMRQVSPVKHSGSFRRTRSASSNSTAFGLRTSSFSARSTPASGSRWAR